MGTLPIVRPCLRIPSCVPWPACPTVRMCVACRPSHRRHTYVTSFPFPRARAHAEFYPSRRHSRTFNARHAHAPDPLDWNPPLADGAMACGTSSFGGPWPAVRTRAAYRPSPRQPLAFKPPPPTRDHLPDVPCPPPPYSRRSTAFLLPTPLSSQRLALPPIQHASPSLDTVESAIYRSVGNRQETPPWPRPNRR